MKEKGSKSHTLGSPTSFPMHAMARYVTDHVTAHTMRHGGLHTLCRVLAVVTTMYGCTDLYAHCGLLFARNLHGGIHGAMDDARSHEGTHAMHGAMSSLAGWPAERPSA